MKFIYSALALLTLTTSIWANTNSCSPTLEKHISYKTTVYFYRMLKHGKNYYIPVLKLENGQLASARTTLIPTDMTLYNLRDNKAVNVHFENQHDNVDFDVCRSLGTPKTRVNDNIADAELFASQPVAKQFNFNPEQADSDQFKKTIQNPCQVGQKPYDKNGITLCDNAKLIATSRIGEQKQFWHTKQYRYDVGFGVDVWNEQAKKINQIAEDCAVCAD